MAQLGSYASALGQMASDAALGGLKGLGTGMKMAAMRDFPALTAATSFAKDVRSRAQKVEDAKSQQTGKRQAVATENLVRQQQTNNVISLDMARQLRSINTGIQAQRSLMSQAQRSQQRADQFAEEEKRERDNYNKKMLQALNRMGGAPSGGGGSPGGGTSDDGGGGLLGFLGSLFGGNLGNIALGAGGAAGAYGLGRRLLRGRGGARVGRGGARRAPFRDSRGRFARATLGRQAARLVGRLGGGLLANPFGKIPGWGWISSGIGAGLMFAPEIYDFFAGDDFTGYEGMGGGGGGMSTRMRNLFMSDTERQRRANLQALYGGVALRQRRLQRPTPYAPRSYVLGREDRTRRRGEDTGRIAMPGNINQQGVSSNIVDQIIQIESGGRSNAAASSSSAYGLAQFTRGTFESLAAQASPGSALYGKTFEDYRNNPALQRAAAIALTNSNIGVLQRRGLTSVDDVAVYLAHFLGAGTAYRVLASADETPITGVVSADQIRANPGVFRNIRTVGDMKAWARRKLTEAQRVVGTGQPASAANAGASASAGGTASLPTITVTGSRIPDPNRPAMNVPGAPLLGAASAGGQRRLAYENGRIRAVTIPTSTSGTQIGTEAGPIPVVDREANERLEDIQKSQGKVEKETKGLAVSSTLAARNFLRRERPGRRVLTPEEEADEYLKKAQQGLLNAIDRTLTKAFKDVGKTMLEGVYGKGYKSVSATQASRVGFAGQELGKILDIDKKTASAMEKLLGKEYGRMLAPAVSQIGKAYLNSIAIGLGQSLFAGTMGADGAKAITGQIIGNFARGNKKLATEQLLFGLTGIASGPETIAQKYGFASAADGIGYMAEVFAAKTTNWMQGAFGWENRTTAQQVRGPDGRMYTPGEGLFGGVVMPGDVGIGYGGMRLADRLGTGTLRTSQMTTMVGKTNNLLAEGALTQNGILLVSVVNSGEFASDDEKFKAALFGGLTKFGQMGISQAMGGPGTGLSVPGYAGGMYNVGGGQTQDIYSLTAAGAPGDLNQNGLVGDRVADTLAQSTEWQQANYSLLGEGQRVQLGATDSGFRADVSTQVAVGQQTVGAINQMGQNIASGMRAMGSRGGGTTIGLPGAAGGSWGQMFANFAVDLGTSFVVSKLTSKIKNPYLNALANFGLNTAAQKYVTPQIMSALGFPTAAAGGAAGAAGATGLMALPVVFSAAGGWSGLGGSIANSFGMGAGGTTFSGFASNMFGNMGWMGASNFFGGMGASSMANAGIAYGTAGSLGYAAGQVLPYAGAITQLLQGNVAGAAVSGLATYALLLNPVTAPFAFLGSLVGGLFGKGKKAPPPKRFDKIVYLKDLDIQAKQVIADENGPSEDVKKFVDAMLNVGFNTAVSIYQVSKVAPKFNAIYMSIVNDKFRMALPKDYTGGKIDSGWVMELTLSDKKNSQYYMLEVMRKIKEIYKQEFADQPDYLKKIDEGYQLVANATAGQLSSGMIAALKYGKYKIGGSEVELGAATQQAMKSYVLVQESGRTVLGTTLNTTTGASSITPASGTTIASSAITPVGSTSAGNGNIASQPVVIADTSTKVGGSTTNNTTYVNTVPNYDVYGRSGTNTQAAVA